MPYLALVMIAMLVSCTSSHEEGDGIDASEFVEPGVGDGGVAPVEGGEGSPGPTGSGSEEPRDEHDAKELEDKTAAAGDRTESEAEGLDRLAKSCEHAQARCEEKLARKPYLKRAGLKCDLPCADVTERATRAKKKRACFREAHNCALDAMMCERKTKHDPRCREMIRDCRAMAQDCADHLRDGHRPGAGGAPRRPAAECRDEAVDCAENLYKSSHECVKRAIKAGDAEALSACAAEAQEALVSCQEALRACL